MIKLPSGVEMHEYLFNVDAHKLLNKIDRFRKLNIKKLTDLQIRKEIMNVLMFDNKSVLLQYNDLIKVEMPIYRIRKLDNSEIPNKDMKVTQDVWNPPNEYVKRGRLNKPQESLLYTCLDIETAIEEAQISENDTFALISYNVVDEIKAIRIGNEDDYSSFSYEEGLKLRIINGFLRDEFTRDVGKGKEYLYKVSEIIAKDYFDLPPRVVQDAWSYPSVANKPSINICFRPEVAKEKLMLTGVQVIEGYNINKNVLHLNVRAILTDSEKGSLNYHPVGSEVQQRLFPEISLK